jgi:hypothetical protein
MGSRVANGDMPGKGYIAALQRVIGELHRCSSLHIETVWVHETFLGKSVWHGNVEVFLLSGHPRAEKCYAWTQPLGRKSKRVRFFAVLGTTVIKTALDAVKMAHLAASGSLINDFSKLGTRDDNPRA